MHQWLGAGEVVVGLLLTVVLALLLFALRRRWLTRQGGVFECSARLGTGRPSGGWSLGVARYNGEMLEWFRFFSYSSRPRIALRRGCVQVVDSRDPDPVEAVALYDGQRVVRVDDRGAVDHHAWELAMDPDSLTGLLSWLESAPPGLPAEG
jgi:hypothetical protein